MTGRTCAHPGCDQQGQWKYCTRHWEQARQQLPPPPPPAVITPGTCQNPDCEQDARLYPGGWHCNQHKPRETTTEEVMTEPCRSCHAPIDWAQPPPGSPGKPHPVNHDSAGNGNLEIWRDPDSTLRYRVLRQDEQPAPGHHRGTSHFATCPHAGTWRKQ